MSASDGPRCGDDPGRAAPTGRILDFESVRLNDLLINRRYEQLLHQNGWTSLEALMRVRGESLTKPGLASWRQRVRLVVGSRGVGSDQPQDSFRPDASPDHRLQTGATPDHRLETGATQTGATPDCEHNQTVYLKRYDRPPRSASAAAQRSGWPARSIAGIEWAVLHALADGGIPSIEPIALGEAFDGRRERCSVLLTAAVPGESLERLVVTHPEEIAARRRALIAATAALVARLHGMGLVHRDLYLSHLFADLDAPGDLSVRLIDVQRVFRPARWRLGRWVVKDLASLNYSAPEELVSRADRVRWLRAYVGVSKLSARDRRLIRRIVAKTRRIARHDERRRRRWQSGSDAG